MSKNVKQFFILKEKSNVIACINFVQKLFGYANGKLYSVQISLYRKSRSSAQNRTMWMWLNTLSPHTGYTPDELHESFKVKFLGVEEKMVEGEILRQPKSTTDLTTKEFTEYLEKIELVATQLNVTLPYPDDIKYAMGY